MILDSFRGTEEWGVKVYAGEEDAASPHAAEEGTADEAVGHPDALSSLGDPAPGHSEPDGDLVEPMPASGDPEAFAEMVDRALAGIAIASRHYAPRDPRIDSSEKSLVLNAAYLVLSDRASEFTAVARALTRAHQGMGAGLTGPWPPYSFADVGPV